MKIANGGSNIKKEDVKNFYEQLFSNDAGEEDVVGKAKAFDQIEEKYYFGNFGSVEKSDLDVLMFSIYIERILNKSQDNFSTYCDDDREQCRKRIKTAVEKNEKLNLEEKKYLEHIPLGQALKNQAPELISSIITECVPCFKGPAKLLSKMYAAFC